MLGKLNLDMGKVRLEMPDAGRQIIKPLLDSIHCPQDVPQMFENEIFCIVRHRPTNLWLNDLQQYMPLLPQREFHHSFDNIR